MKIDIGYWIVALLITYTIIDGFCRWGPTYYHSNSYKKVRTTIDSVRWVGRYNKNPTCFSNSYPNKIIWISKKAYLNQERPIDSNRNFTDNFEYEVWNSPHTNYIYGVEKNEEEFPKNKFLKYCILGAIPIILFYGFEIFNFIRRRNKKHERNL